MKPTIPQKISLHRIKLCTAEIKKTHTHLYPNERSVNNKMHKRRDFHIQLPYSWDLFFSSSFVFRKESEDTLHRNRNIFRVLY